MNQTELQRCLKVGQIAACEAGDVLLDYKAKGFKVSKKGRVNLVTEADLASEKIIVSHIQENFPDHRILAEESGNQSGEGELLRIDAREGYSTWWLADFQAPELTSYR